MAGGTVRVGILIGAAVNASFRAAFGSATRASQDLGQSITRAGAAQAAIGARIAAGMANGGRGLRGLTEQYARMTRAINSANTAQIRLNNAITSRDAGRNNRQALRGQAMETGAHAYAVGRPIFGAVKAFIGQEEAATSLKVSMMKADGSFGAFSETLRQATAMGKELPGTMTDFIGAAKALKGQGMSDAKLNGGALKASAQLSIVMETDQATGAENVAKIFEGAGLKESEFEEGVNLTQKAKFSGGLSSDGMLQAMQYIAPTLTSLDITGIKNYETFLAIQGIMGKRATEGSTFGTNTAALLMRMAKGVEMVALSKKGMKGEARDIGEKSNVKLNFYDKKGNFAGLDNMMVQLEKINKIRKDQGDKAAQIFTDGVFGVEAGRVAISLAKEGLAGLEKEKKLMSEQASLAQRIEVKINTLGSAFESLGGVAEQALGVFGGAFASDLKAFAATAQDLVERKLHPWIIANKGLIVGTVKVIGALLAFKMATVTIAYSISALISPFKMLYLSGARMAEVFARFKLWRVEGGFTRLGSTLGRVGRWFGVAGRFALRLGAVMGGALTKGLIIAGKAVLWIGRALMMNPIGLIVMAIAGAAYLIYKYWEPIKGFFTRLWDNVTGIFSRYSTAISGAVSGMWESVTGFFNSGIGNISAVILNWSPIGLFYKAFAGVLSWFGVDLPSSFTEFGGNLISGLVSGITNKLAAAKETIVNFGSSIKGWFTSALGIKSPSRVFKGYGDNIVQGAAIGIDQTIPVAKKSVGKLGNTMLSAALAVSAAASNVSYALPAVKSAIMPSVAAPQAIKSHAVSPRITDSKVAMPKSKPDQKKQTAKSVDVPNAPTYTHLKAPEFKPIMPVQMGKPTPVMAMQPKTKQVTQAPASTPVLGEFGKQMFKNDALDQLNARQNLVKDAMAALNASPDAQSELSSALRIRDINQFNATPAGLAKNAAVALNTNPAAQSVYAKDDVRRKNSTPVKVAQAGRNAFLTSISPVLNTDKIASKLSINAGLAPAIDTSGISNVFKNIKIGDAVKPDQQLNQPKDKAKEQPKNQTNKQLKNKQKNKQEGLQQPRASLSNDDKKERALPEKGIADNFTDKGQSQQNSGTNITINFSPVINTKDASGVAAACKLSINELEQMLKTIDYRNNRRSY